MRKQFIAQLNELNQNVIKMGSILELSINEVIVAFNTLDMDKANRIIERDNEIDLLEQEIERECINLIAKQQPLAKDLREITSIMKIITDIERIADQCADISEYIIRLSKLPHIQEPVKLDKMIDAMKNMVINTIDAFVKKDLEQARKVIKEDDVVDKHFDHIRKELMVMMKSDPNIIEQGMHYLMIIKYIERMADHSTNIAEWIKFVVTGKLTIG